MRSPLRPAPSSSSSFHPVGLGRKEFACYHAICIFAHRFSLIFFKDEVGETECLNDVTLMIGFSFLFDGRLPLFQWDSLPDGAIPRDPSAVRRRPPLLAQLWPKFPLHGRHAIRQHYPPHRSSSGLRQIQIPWMRLLGLLKKLLLFYIHIITDIE